MLLIIAKMWRHKTNNAELNYHLYQRLKVGLQLVCQMSVHHVDETFDQEGEQNESDHRVESLDFFS